MTPTTLALFALAALLVIATPGPTVLLALVNGSRHGIGRAGWGMAGAVLSDVVLCAAAALGLGALLATSEVAFSVVKWVGVAYLAFLGVALLRSKGRLALPAGAEGSGASRRALFAKSFGVAVTNPKGYLFVSAFLPQFVDPTQPQAAQYLVLTVVFCALDFTVMVGYALLGSQAVRWLRGDALRWLDRACGGALLALAGSLALYRRAS